MAKLVARIGLVSALTMVSRILGLLRDMMSSAMLGASIWNSAFVTAFTLPNLFRRLLGEGALTAALMPNLSEELEQRGKEAVHELVNKTLSWLVVICVMLVVGAVGFFQFLRWLDVSEKWSLVAELAQILFPYTLLICLAAITSAALNLFGRFGVPALTAVWLNASIILALGYAGWMLGSDLETRTYWLCGGALFGGVLQMLIPAVALTREGWRPRLDLAVSPRLQEVALLTLPGILGAAVFQINIMVSRSLAFSVSDAAASLLYYANRLVELPVGVFAVAISTVVFPSLSAAISAGRKDEFSLTYRRGILFCLLLALPSAVGLCVLAPEIIALLFERGEFTAADTSDTIPLVYAFALGMPFYSFVAVETRAYYALKDTRTPVRAAGLVFAVNLGLSLLLMGRWGAVGLAIATNAAAIVQASVLHWQLRSKNMDTSLRGIAPDFLRVVLASVLMGGLVLAVSAWLARLCGAGAFGLSISVFVSIVLGAAAYFAVLQLAGLKLKALLK